VGGGQSGRVVDAVADQQHPLTGLFPGAYGVDLVWGSSPARTSLMPTSEARRSAARVLSPVSSTGAARHPAIAAAALVGTPDAQRGEKSVAFLVCPGQTPGTGELAAFLKQRGLAAYKAPDQVITVDRLPLTAVGKVDKKALAQQLPGSAPMDGRR
jgi:hypothetical protein